MKLIVRNRNKQIQFVNVASKEEMVWVDPEVYSQLSHDAAEAAINFMKEHPKIHEIKFSTLPELDPDEDEENFDAYDEPQGEGDQTNESNNENGEKHD
ncbi:MAG: hypothetical protein IJY03_04390 [Prevotella sp.]|nr:hypothetical protein [Prevotella sp.]